MCATVENVWMTKSELSLGKQISSLRFSLLYQSDLLTFGRDEEKNTDGSEKEITYGEYVEKINKRALEEQKKIMLARMRGELKKQEDNDN